MESSRVLEPTQVVGENGPQMGNEAGRTLPRENRSSCSLRERRRQERCSLTAAATIFEPDSETRVEAHTTDVCLDGCYVDTVSGLPVGTIVEVRLTKDGELFHSVAKVVSSQVGMGMGLSFSSMEHDQFLLLERWLKELRGERIHEPRSLEQDEATHCGLEGSALEALLVQLMSKGVLSEEEGEPILRRLLH